MFKLTKQPQLFNNFFCVLSNKNQTILNTFRPYVIFVNNHFKVKSHSCFRSGDLLFKFVPHELKTSRQKSKTKKASPSRKFKEEDESDDDDDEDDEFESEDDEFVKIYTLTSLRIDLMLKQILNQKRKKIEECFYNNKIRVNGKVLLKKAETANIGDEIDIIKGMSKSDSKMIEVSRIIVLNAKMDSEETGKIKVKAKKLKSLIIENYPDGDTWKDPESEGLASS